MMRRPGFVVVSLVALAGCTDTLVDHNASRAQLFPPTSCQSGEQECGGGCYPHDALICNPSTCTVCPAPPAGAHALCLPAGICDFACDGDLVRCGNSCLAAGTFTCGGGDACAACPIPAGAVGVCGPLGECRSECPGNTRLCGAVAGVALGACIAESVDSCGPCGNQCPAPSFTTGAAGVAVCNTVPGAPGQGQCGVECTTGNLCGGGCVAEDERSCGASCADCTLSAPLNASGKCTAAHACDFVCDDGWLRCGDGCCQATEVSAGFAHACAVTTQGGLVCWGANESGQLGIGTRVGSSVPVTVYPSGSGVAQAAAGYSHTCVVFVDGRVACWGDNTTGEVGVSTSGPPVLTPAIVPLAKPARWAACGGGGPSVFAHTCVVNTDDSVTCWGLNSEGQIGTGATSPFPSGPVDVPGLTLHAGNNVLAVGASHTCAVSSVGAVWCWGANDKQQSGDVAAGVTTHPSPFQVPGISDASAVMAGDDHTCAIQARSSGGGGGGGVTRVGVCWGANKQGQVTPGAITDVAGPTLVDSGTFGSLDVASGATGPDFTCLVSTEGKAKCFGNNSQNQLSTGVGCVTGTKSICEPAPPVGARFQAVSGGWSFSCAFVVPSTTAPGALAPGGVVCVGANGSGQLGDGKAQVDHAVPAYVFGG